MRQSEHAAKGLQLARVQAQLAHPAQSGVLAEQAQHDRFAMQHRNDGDADVHLAVVHTDLDAAILREAFFGDVQVTENFHARDNRRLKALNLRRDGNFLQDPIDAIADLQLVLEWFQVNVRGTQLEPFEDELQIRYRID